MCRQESESIAAWNAPIAAPTAWNEPAWHHYLHEIYYRVFAPSDEEMSAGVATTVLRPPTEKDFGASLPWLKEALTEKSDLPDYDFRAIGSPDYEGLAQRIEEIARRVPSGRLSGVDLIVVMDSSRAAEIRAALARSGAKLHIVDPLQKLPQRVDRIQKTEAAQLPVCHVGTAQ
jgi:hypothetical protein